MFYGQSILVPPNPTARSVLGMPSLVNVEYVRISPGTTGQVWIGFPDGCYGLVHVVVFHWGYQIWPAEPGKSLNWNDYVFTFEDPFDLTTEPYEFNIRTWSYDDFYPHTIFFGVIVKPTPRIVTALSMDQVYEELGIELGG